ncbi:MAG: amidase, partial [bacterium]
MTALHTFSIQQLRNAIKRREVSFREITETFLSRIEEVDTELKSFLTVDADSALTQADELDRKRFNRELGLGLLTGIPLAIKDNIITKGLRTTCASKILENYVPPYDATVIRKLKNDKSVLMGKTNCDEFAMGSSTENSGFSPTRNPWDLDHVPGGSSGGSAAAVAAKLVPGALGSDTGGSIRQPAAFCGTVGLKPTYGRVSRYGLVAFGSSLDQIGPIANTVRDVATILQVVAGWDKRDSTSANLRVDNYVAEIGKDVFDLKVGVPAEWFGSGLDPIVEKAVRNALDRL